MDLAAGTASGAAYAALLRGNSAKVVRKANRPARAR